MLEITIPTEPKPFKWTQERGADAEGKPKPPIEWSALIVPADLALRTRTAYYIDVAIACVKSITAATCGGEEVRIRSDKDASLKPATDPTVREVVLRNFEFGAVCGREAERLGQLVEHERGN